MRHATHGMRLPYATATTTLFATHVFLCLCSVRSDKRQVTRDVSPAIFGIATWSDRWRDFLEVARHCDIICTKYRSLTWILRFPSLQNATVGWTVHELLFKRFPKGWQLIQQCDIDVPRMCLYWCREWELHCRFLFCFALYRTGIMKAADAIISSSCNSSIEVIFVWKLLIVSHVTEHTFIFCRATGDSICRQSPVACCLSRITEHGLSYVQLRATGDTRQATRDISYHLSRDKK